MTNREAIVEAFLKWFGKDSHSEHEDFYAGRITEERLSQLSDEEFKNFFLQFVREGGKIQTGGHRQLNQLQQSIEDNFEEFRARILAPFQPGFDVERWLEWADGFKYFGKGIATIFLNRVDKEEYAIRSIDRRNPAQSRLALFCRCRQGAMA